MVTDRKMGQEEQVGAEVIVCFVDTGGIIYHHCVNFLFNVNMILMNDLHLFVIFLFEWDQALHS